MSATPKYGVMTFIGLLSRQTYNKDVYVSDVASALINWDGGAGASSTSPTWVQFREPVRLIDFAIATGTADTTKINLTRNGVQFGQVLRYATRLDSLANRTPVSIVFQSGEQIGAIQAA